MNIVNIINKSQKHTPLNEEEMKWLVEAYVQNQIPDYQVATWLATVFLNELSVEETYFLTQSILDSGEKMSWNFKAVDKHSTGGVGDKTSLIIGPLVASLGYHVPMISGRGLGHTGGTLDKLESIPGFQTQIDLKNFKQNVCKKNLCFIGQTQEICPADKKFYALRDATHTVANIPLICSSIMSKKISEGISGLVLDVKFGSGAFMPDPNKAQDLAQRLLQIAEKNGIKAYAVLSSMEQPLGRFIGNKLEVQECLRIMKDPQKFKKEYQDTYDLSLLLSALMVVSIDKQIHLNDALQECREKLDSGEVYKVFKNIVTHQNGDIEKLEVQAKTFELKAKSSGHFEFTNVKNIGLAGVLLGVGRKNLEDLIDSNVGFYCHKKTSDEVTPGETLFTIYYNDEQKLKDCLETLKTGFEVSKSVTKMDLIHKVLEIENNNLKQVNYERYC